MPQTTYLLDQVAAVAGQIVAKETVVGKYAASEDIPPGRLVELHTDGKLRLYRGGRCVGVSCYKGAKEPGPWVADDYVQVLREGVIWADFSGTSSVVTEAYAFTDAKGRGNSVTATDRGKVTDAVASGTSDAEVYTLQRVKFYGGATSDTGLVQVEVECP